MLLFIAGQPSNTRIPRKLRCAGECQRSRWSLPQPPWLLDRLGTAGHAEMMQLPEGHIGILARIEAGSRYTDAFTQWTDEELLLWSFLRRPLDAYSFHIRRAIIMRDKPSVSKGSRTSHHGIQDVPAYVDLDRLVGHIADASSTWDCPGKLLTNAQVKKFLGVTNEAWVSFSRNPSCVWLPTPIPLLISRGRWSSVLTTVSAWIAPRS